MLRLYKALVSMAAPLVALWFAVHSARRPQLARFRPNVPSLPTRPIWVHACSVGEVNTAKPLLDAIQRQWPDRPIILTVSTPTGKTLAESLELPAEIAWFPFDAPIIVRRFVQRLRPQALVLIETELWPSVLTETARFGAPILLANGRLSDRRTGSYRRIAPLMRPTVRCLTAAAMQNERYARRLEKLGADPARITTTGNLKFDAAVTDLAQDDRQALRRELALPPEAPLIVFGSTRPGDEALAAQCWRPLREEFPELRLVVAPRHLNRLDEARSPFAGDAVRLRSEPAQTGTKANGARVILLDTHGELVRFYAIASLAVIGGSFFPGVEGHNPIEPAALGVPPVFGPYMRNFQDPAEALIAGHGAIQVDAPDALCGALRQLLHDAQTRREIGLNARRTVLQNRGAIQRTVDLLAPLLQDK